MRSSMLLAVLGAVGCTDAAVGVDPETAERATIDRFSAAAGHLWVRTADNGLPAAGEAIDYDARFVIEGLAPTGQRVKHYDFDVQAREPAPIYAFVDGQGRAVAGQLNVVTVVPGTPGYNDLWQVVRVTVPSGYVANEVTSFEEIAERGFATETTPELVNCPVVPEGSVARVRMAGDYAELHQGWYGGQIIQYFHFGERALVADAGRVPVSTVYVAYDVNPGEPGGGPSSGFATESGSAQTHNVTATVPADAAYAPLWDVRVYDRAAFSSVRDLATATAAARVETAAMILNAPIVAIEER